MLKAAFLSYCFRDQLAAETIKRSLEQAGLSVWIASDEMQAGDTLTPTLRGEIDQASCLVVLLTFRSAKSKWVALEVEHALQTKKRVIFFAIDGSKPGAKFPPEASDLVRIQSTSKIPVMHKERLIQAVRFAHRTRAPVLAFMNMKGGVGKTTLAAHLCGCVHEQEKKSVLLIDLDPQHNLSQLVVPIERLEHAWNGGRSVMSIFEPSQINGFPSPGEDLENIRTDGDLARPDQIAFPLKPAVRGAPRFDMILGHFEVIKYTTPRSSEQCERLRQNFDDFIRQAQKSYDIVVIDINPGCSFLTDIALNAATHLISPVKPDRYSRRGLDMMDWLVDRVLRLKHSPQRLAIMNEVNRQEQSDIEAIIRVSNRKVLEARIAQSKLLRAGSMASPFADDLTRSLAYRSNLSAAKPIKQDLSAAAAELVRELTPHEPGN